MNGFGLSEAMAQKLNVSQEVAREKLDAMLECITEELEKGEIVKLVNFGTFSVLKQASKKGFQPYYRRVIEIPPCNRPIFRPGKELKEAVQDELE